MNENLSELEIRERNKKVQELQPDGKTPFLFIPATCPVCSKESIQKQFRSNIFTVSEKDIDLRPTKYAWDDNDFKNINPLVHYIWQCPHCLFSANKQYFENPVEDVISTINNFRKRSLENLNSNEDFNKCLEVLSVNDDQDPEYFAATKKYLTAILFFQNINTIKERDSLPLAKLHIRLYWLLKDMNDRASDKHGKLLVDHLKFSLTPIWKDAPINLQTALTQAIETYDRTYMNSKIPEEKKIEHQILQVLGRLHVVNQNINEGRRLFLQGIQVANKFKAEYEARIKELPNSILIKDELMPEINKINNFVIESQDLLYESKQMIKK